MKLSVSEIIEKYDVAIVLFWLFLLEFAVFGRSIKLSGFYLDDWTMLHILHFAHGNPIQQAIQYFATDARVAIRPVEAPYFVLLHHFFRNSPIGYHFASACLEVMGLWIFYIIIRDVCKNKAIAFISATLSLVDPKHDTTRYWVMCNSIWFSFFLTMASLRFTQLFSRSQKRWQLLVAILLFTLGVFNYEVFTPFLLFHGALLGYSGITAGQKLKKTFMSIAIFAMPVASLMLYQKWILLQVPNPLAHVIEWNFPAIVHALWDGFLVQFSPHTYGDLFQKIILEQANILKRNNLWLLVPLLVNFLLSGAFLRTTMLEGHNQQKNFNTFQNASVLGILTVIISYSIFSLNHEYHPDIATIFNRVNTGGSLGASLVIAAALYGLYSLTEHHLREKSTYRSVVLPLFTSSIATGFLLFNCLASLAMEPSWLVSYETQRNVQTIIRTQANQLKPGDSLLLMNCPKYVNWSPVFDGVWDFERMLQLTLNNRNIHGGVVSPRMTISATTIKDISCGYLCGQYNFPNIFILDPNKKLFEKTSTTSQFLKTVSAPNQTFPIPQDVIEKWNAEEKSPLPLKKQ